VQRTGPRTIPPAVGGVGGVALRTSQLCPHLTNLLRVARGDAVAEVCLACRRLGGQIQYLGQLIKPARGRLQSASASGQTLLTGCIHYNSARMVP